MAVDQHPLIPFDTVGKGSAAGTPSSAGPRDRRRELANADARAPYPWDLELHAGAMRCCSAQSEAVGCTRAVPAGHGRRLQGLKPRGARPAAMAVFGRLSIVSRRPGLTSPMHSAGESPCSRAMQSNRPVFLDLWRIKLPATGIVSLKPAIS